MQEFTTEDTEDTEEGEKNHTDARRSRSFLSSMLSVSVVNPLLGDYTPTGKGFVCGSADKPANRSNLPCSNDIKPVYQ